MDSIELRTDLNIFIIPGLEHLYYKRSTPNSNIFTLHYLYEYHKVNLNDLDKETIDIITKYSLYLKLMYA
jgi:hypothetical protein